MTRHTFRDVIRPDVYGYGFFENEGVLFEVQANDSGAFLELRRTDNEVVVTRDIDKALAFFGMPFRVALSEARLAAERAAEPEPVREYRSPKEYGAAKREEAKDVG